MNVDFGRNDRWGKFPWKMNENDMLTHQTEKLYGNDIRIGKKKHQIYPNIWLWV